MPCQYTEQQVLPRARDRGLSGCRPASGMSTPPARHPPSSRPPTAGRPASISSNRSTPVSDRSSTTTPVPASPALDSSPLDPRRWKALAFIGIAQLMVVLDATIVNIALPQAQADLAFSDADRQWVVTAYGLAFGGLLLLGGRLGDLWGRKRVFLIGLLGFAVASAVGGAAVNIAMLLGARALQGLFAALLAPAALSLVAVTFTDARERDHRVRRLQRHRRRRRRGRPAAGRRAHRVRRLALVPLRQHRLRRRRGDRSGGVRARARRPAQPRPARPPRRPAGHHRARRTGLRLQPSRAGRLGRSDDDRAVRRRRRPADRLRARRAPRRRAPAAAARGHRPQPGRRVPRGRPGHDRHVRPVLLPGLLLPAGRRVLAAHQRVRLPPAHRRPDPRLHPDRHPARRPGADAPDHGPRTAHRRPRHAAADPAHRGQLLLGPGHARDRAARRRHGRRIHARR